MPVPNSYGENQSFDKNGNITRLDRYGEFDDAVVALMIDISGIVYGNGIMEAIPTSEGCVKNTVTGGSNVFNYVFSYADHLDNLRLSYTKNQSTGAVTIMEENNYYPFGLKHKNYNTSERIYNKTGLGIPPTNVCVACPVAYKYNYKFNGQELQEDLGLNMYDMDFRDYDPAIAR